MKKISLISGLAFLGLFIGQSALAVCPLCVVAIGAGLGLSRWLGVDDLVSSVWIGGLILAMAIWTIDWLNRKNIKFAFKKPLVIIGYYVLILVPMYYGNIIGHPLNKVFGIDKIVFGTFLGTLVLILAVLLNSWLKKKNGGKVYFPFQKVAVPVASLIITSLITYLLIK